MLANSGTNCFANSLSIYLGNSSFVRNRCDDVFLRYHVCYFFFQDGEITKRLDDFGVIVLIVITKRRCLPARC